jgi:hypothetical protein
MDLRADITNAIIRMIEEGAANGDKSLWDQLQDQAPLLWRQCPAAVVCCC